MPVLEPIPLTVVGGGAELPSLLEVLIEGRPDLALVMPDGNAAHPGISSSDRSSWRAAARLVTVVPDVGERSPGCGCCRLRLDLVEAIGTLVRRRSRPAHIVVAVPDAWSHQHPGASSVVTAVHTVLSDPELRRWVRLDGVVATVDAVEATTRRLTGSAVFEELGAERLAIADRVVIARADAVVPSSLHELHSIVRQVNRIAPLLARAGERATAELLSIDAWHGAPRIFDPIHRGAAAATLGPAIPATVVIEQRGILDPGGVEEWLDAVLSGHASRLLRLQGALAVDGVSSRVCCRAVGSSAMSHPEHEHDRGGPSDASLMVLIGHGLPAEELAEGLRATAVR